MSKKYACYQGNFGFWVASSMPQSDGTYDTYDEAALEAARQNLQKALHDKYAHSKMDHADVTYLWLYEHQIEIRSCLVEDNSNTSNTPANV